MSLSSPLRQPPSEALDLSQQTTQHLQKYASTGTSIMPIPFLSYPESTELWIKYERYLLSCLRTGDNKAAHVCLERLMERFGATNERVMGLRGLYQEAVAKDEHALGEILKEYNEVLAEDPVNTVRLHEEWCMECVLISRCCSQSRNAESPFFALLLGLRTQLMPSRNS